MKLKDIECNHQWIWNGMSHIFNSNGFIEDTNFELTCKKCGKILVTKEIFNYEYELGSNQIDIDEYEPWRKIFT